MPEVCLGEIRDRLRPIEETQRGLPIYLGRCISHTRRGPSRLRIVTFATGAGGSNCVVSYAVLRRLFNNFQLKVGGLFGVCQAWAKDISTPLDLDIWHNHVHFGFVWESNGGFQTYPALLYDTLKRSNAHGMRLLVISFCFHFLTFSLNPVRGCLAHSDCILLHATWLANCSFNWRRVIFIVTSGDRFIEAVEINDLFEQESPVGRLYVKLKEMGIQVEREWWIDEEGTTYIVDLALPVEDGWLPVTFGDRPGPASGLRFAIETQPQACVKEIQARLRRD